MYATTLWQSVEKFYYAANYHFSQVLEDDVNVPSPDPGGSAPEPLEKIVKVGLNLLAWGGTVAGVVGVLVTGAMMAVSHKRGEGSEHMGRLGMVLGGCILIAVAGPVVSWVFSDGVGPGGAAPDGG